MCVCVCVFVYVYVCVCVCVCMCSARAEAEADDEAAEGLVGVAARRHVTHRRPHLPPAPLLPRRRIVVK